MGEYGLTNACFHGYVLLVDSLAANLMPGGTSVQLLHTLHDIGHICATRTIERSASRRVNMQRLDIGFPWSMTECKLFGSAPPSGADLAQRILSSDDPSDLSDCVASLVRLDAAVSYVNTLVKITKEHRTL